MKYNPVRNIVRRALRKEGDIINVLSCPTHSSFESKLCNFVPNLNIYAMNEEHTINGWIGCHPQPSNYTVLPRGAGDAGVPSIDFDLVLVQNLVQMPYLGKYMSLAKSLAIFHTYPPMGATQQQLAPYHNIPFDRRVFITESNMRAWGFQKSNQNVVIHHCVDLDVFKPLGLDRQNHICHIANEMVQRSREIGYDIFKYIVDGIPTKHYGRCSMTTEFNNPTNSIDENVRILNECGVYLNCAPHSPLPTVVAEAAACGNAIVSIDAPGIREYFTHGVNALLFPGDRPDLGKQYVLNLLKDNDMRDSFGLNARMMAESRFSPERFSAEWSNLLEDILSQ